MKRLTLCAFTLLACMALSQGQELVSQPNPNLPARHGSRRILIVGGIDNTMDSGGTHHGLRSAEIYDQPTHLFSLTGSMIEGRVGHVATRLRDGRVLVTGGDGAETNHPVASAEVYNPRTHNFTLVGAMTTARVGHTATLLQNGLVLLAGGQNATFTNVKSAELFNPASGTFADTGNMHAERTGHTATLLRNGKVLIAGGSLLSTAELYDPATGMFTETGSMSTRRSFATATLLRNGKVLITGGGSIVGNCFGCSVNSAEIYDPEKAQFEPVQDMHFARRGHIAVRLNDNEVLIAGGLDDQLPDPERFLESAEIFDVRTLTFSDTANMTIARFGHTASLLRNGDVLIAGGFIDGLTITDSAELFKARNHAFEATANMTDARAEHTSTGLK